MYLLTCPRQCQTSKNAHLLSREQTVLLHCATCPPLARPATDYVGVGITGGAALIGPPCQCSMFLIDDEQGPGHTGVLEIPLLQNLTYETTSENLGNTL